MGRDRAGSRTHRSRSPAHSVPARAVRRVWPFESTRRCSRVDPSVAFAFPRVRADPCYFLPNMTKEMLDVFDSCKTAYNEVVVSTAPGDVAIQAVIGGRIASKEWHADLLAHFGVNERQLPMLKFGPGLKGHAPLFA